MSAIRPGRGARRLFACERAHMPAALIYLFFALLVAPVGAQAGVYKWTDSEGNVHFSDSPPAQSKAEKAVEDDDGGGRSAVSNDITGRWMSRGIAGAHYLELDEDKTFVYSIGAERRRGTWSYNSPELRLDRYSDSASDASGSGERTHRVIDLKPSRLHLRMPDGRTRLFLRSYGRSNLSDQEQRMVGFWAVTDMDLKILFKSRGLFYFEQKGAHGTRPEAYGNWYRQGDVVTLEFLRMQVPPRSWAGRPIRFKIDFEDGSSLRLAAQSGDRVLKLNKISHAAGH